MARSKTRARNTARGQGQSSEPAGGGDSRVRILREQLARMLSEEQAHAGFDRAVADFPPGLAGAKIPGAAHTPWQVLEHLRIAQSDILEFSRNPRHVSPAWPEGYWPPLEAPPDARAWRRSIEAFRRDLKAMIALVMNSRTDLFARLAHGTGQTVLRQALLLADHNAYHIGQLILLRRLAGAW